MSVTDEADELAQELFEAKIRLRGAGRALHDHVGPLLSAAGINLDLLRSDHPSAAASAAQVTQALTEAMERIRDLSRELNPPPAAHLGLKRALTALAEACGESYRGRIDLVYDISAGVP